MCDSMCLSNRKCLQIKTYSLVTQYLVWQGDESPQCKLVAAFHGWFGDSSQSSCEHSLSADSPDLISTTCPQILQGQKVDLEE